MNDVHRDGFGQCLEKCAHRDCSLAGNSRPRPFRHSTTPKWRQIFSSLLEKTRTHPQAHPRTTCALTSIKYSHPGSTHDPGFPHVLPKAGFSCPPPCPAALAWEFLQKRTRIAHKRLCLFFSNPRIVRDLPWATLVSERLTNKRNLQN